MAKPTTQLNTWDADLADQAKVAAAAESTGGDRLWISMNGALTINKVALPNNELPGVVLDALFVNTLYTRAYDPNKPESPDCFALGRALPDGSIIGIDTKTGTTELAPHKDVKNPVCETCAACPMNQFGTGKKQDGTPSKGKACQNTRRLAVVPAGSMENGKFKPFNAADFAAQKIHFLKLSPTNGKNFSNHVVNVAAVESRPLWATYNLLTRVFDAKTQYRVDWKFLGKIPDSHRAATEAHLELAKSSINFGFAQFDQQPEPEPAGKGKKAAPNKSKY